MRRRREKNCATQTEKSEWMQAMARWGPSLGSGLCEARATESTTSDCLVNQTRSSSRRLLAIYKSTWRFCCDVDEVHEILPGDRLKLKTCYKTNKSFSSEAFPFGILYIFAASFYVAENKESAKWFHEMHIQFFR